MPLVELSDVQARHGRDIALTDINMAVDGGEIVTIVGPNGSGKTTLLRLIIGAQPVHRGTITRDPNLRIGYVPQRLRVDRGMPITVDRFMHLPQRRSPGAVTEALAAAGAGGLAGRALDGLSGGQFQRVMLARALVGNPNLLLLDEPTTGLDQPGSASFYRQIEAVRDATGAAVMMVSHELHVVMSASDRVICLNGHVCCHGAPETVASAPEYRALFGSGTLGALALYRHEHNHHHHHHHQDHDHHHDGNQDRCDHA